MSNKLFFVFLKKLFSTVGNVKDVWRNTGSAYQNAGKIRKATSTWTILNAIIHVFLKRVAVWETSRRLSVGSESCQVLSGTWKSIKQYYRGLIMLLLGKKRRRRDWSLPLPFDSWIFFILQNALFTLNETQKRSRDEEKQRLIDVLLCSSVTVCKISDQCLFGMKEVQINVEMRMLLPKWRKILSQLQLNSFEFEVNGVIHAHI